MKAIYGLRGCGKTTRLIKEAFEQNAIIVVPHLSYSYEIEYLADKMGVKVKIITIFDYCKRETHAGKTVQNFVFDELESSLTLLSHGKGRVIGVSFTGCGEQL